ncbi:TrmB family transcriptional regulator [Natrialba swarupiae]|uniref:TrmB family transcriptional regulator n=1 Tax=Natrialba swarupiae TaxID=2448032 RepID=A0A5D5APW3_9EURY|nr:TrmB family transcriptional regulator [Natrialba swarupiae]TYT61500.1 TrmB family transcriptional regulator [Natrialba swarupiae]
MDRSRLRTALEEGGLTSYQTDAYLTLLDRGMASVTEVANNSSIPSSQIYDVLRALEDKGYIETLEQDTLHARPVDPEHVLEDLRERGSLLVEAADEIEERWQRPEMSDHYMTVFKSEDTVVRRAKEQIDEAEIGIEVACQIEQFERLKPNLKAAKERGVVIKIVVYCPNDPSELLEENLEPYASEVRACYIPGPFVAVIDHTKTCYTPNMRPSEPFGLVFDDPLLSFIFHWFFQICQWAIWEPILPRHDPPTSYVSIQGFIRDIGPLFLEGASLEISVEGIVPETGEDRTISGTITEVVYPGRYRNELPTYERLGGKAAMAITTTDGTYTIGGWGAVFEDLAAKVITLENITLPHRLTE